ncbi:hypothetical protein [Pseudomonas aeruginosa]|uniref:hypothetical protein n=1 Tax=Pseudomonas aeruginosa TaxID=287 RepID=UPI002E28E9BA|nr:hypothetical protein [Pseudomonas aeruginosa]
MSGNLIPFGMRDGQLYQADEVDNGLSCGCICPECKRPLVAANEGEKVLPYFRHAQAACADGFTAGIRRRAIEVLQTEGQIMLAPYREHLSAKSLYGTQLQTTVEFGARLLAADRVEAHVTIDGQVIDAAVWKDGHQLAVHFRVAKRPDLAKVSRLSTLGISVLQVDLSQLDMETVLDREAFRQAISFEPALRSWLFSERGHRLAKIANDRLLTEIDKLNVQEREEHQRQLDKDLEERARQRAAAALRSIQQHELREASRLARAAAEEAYRNTPESLAAQARIDGLKQVTKQRADAISATICQAVLAWGGIGAECQRCFLVSEPNARHCVYCNGSGTFTTMTFGRDYLANVHQRMKSSHKPYTSYTRVPALICEPREVGAGDSHL